MPPSNVEKSNNNNTNNHNAPKFDVHGYSGCPLQVLGAPSFSLVQKTVNSFHRLSRINNGSSSSSSSENKNEKHQLTPSYGHSTSVRHRYFVLKLSSSVSYNPRLKKQAEKQQAFYEHMSSFTSYLKGAGSDFSLLMANDGNFTSSSVLSPSSVPANATIHVPPIIYIEGESAELVRSFLLDEDSAKKFEKEFIASNNDNNTNESLLHDEFISSWMKTNLSSSLVVEKQDTTNSKNNLLSGVIMPFIHHSDCLRFLCTANIGRVQRFEEHLASFLRWQVHSYCSMKTCPVGIILDKLEDLKRVCSRPQSILQNLKVANDTMTMSEACVETLDKLIAFFKDETIFNENMKIPMGCCHGDLTLSNILVQENVEDKIVLIDFLDSFLESPLSDMCKLNQDLTHGWTIRMLATNNQGKKNPENTVDPVRLYILFERMMKKIVLEPFAKEDWFKSLFRPLCVISQMRVLQYSVEENVAHYLWKTIEYEKECCDEKIWKY